MTSKTIGFIGLGDMGKPMAANLLAKGFRVLSCAHRRREAIEELKKNGLIEKESPKAVAEEADVLMTIVVDEAQTETVLRGDDGALAGLRAGTTLILMSTLSPDYCQALARSLADRPIHVVDCPVSGAAMGAEAGTLALIAGGDRERIEDCREALEAMGTIYHCGGVGHGMVAKLANTAIAIETVSLILEARAMAKAYGVDMATLMEIFKNGTANSFMVQAWDFVVAFAPDNYELIVKDMTICKETAQSKGVHMPMLDTHLSKDFKAISANIANL